MIVVAGLSLLGWYAHLPLGAVDLTYVAASVRHAPARSDLGLETGLAVGAWLIGDLHMQLRAQPQPVYDWSTGKMRLGAVAPSPAWSARLIAFGPRALLCVGACSPLPLWPSRDGAAHRRPPRRRGRSDAAHGHGLRARWQPIGAWQLGFDAHWAPVSMARQAPNDPWRASQVAHGARTGRWSVAAAAGWRRAMATTHVAVWSMLRTQPALPVSVSSRWGRLHWDVELAGRVEGARVGGQLRAGRCVSGACADARFCVGRPTRSRLLGCVAVRLRGKTRTARGRLQLPLRARWRGALLLQLSGGRGAVGLVSAVRLEDPVAGLQFGIQVRVKGNQAQWVTPTVMWVRPWLALQGALALPLRQGPRLRGDAAARVSFGLHRRQALDLHMQASVGRYAVFLRYAVHLAAPGAAV